MPLNLQQHILNTLAYFDLFDYPITLQETQAFLQCTASITQVQDQLNILAEQGIIFQLGDTYSLHHDLSLLKRRKDGSDHAAHLMKRATRIAAWLQRFPYVRAIGVSGSLSKNFAAPGADIDFFIITCARRLWVCRSLLHVLKKLSYLVGKQHDLCMNYFIDESALEIREQNIYTATEVVTVIPLAGEAVFESFYTANAWTNTFLPNRYMRITQGGEIRQGRLTRMYEYIFNNRAGDLLDSLLLRITRFRWKLKSVKGQANMHGFTLSLDAGPHHAKPSPYNFQRHLLDQYALKKTYVANMVEHVPGSREAIPF